MHYGLVRLASMQAKGKEYEETGEISQDARKVLMREALQEIERIQKEQDELFARNRAEGFENHHSQLEQKRIRYQKKKKNKDYGLKRHRQKRIIGKRSRRNDRLWEKGMILKKAYHTFKAGEDR